jgi:alginate O-acetyltransferase complex protein AlgI
MVFRSTVFLFCFLPLLLPIYFLAPNRTKNSILLAASLLFYAWGEMFYTAVMLFSILSNYVFGLLIEKSKVSSRKFLVLGVGCNLLLLGVFKYADFFVETINIFTDLLSLPQLKLQHIHLPLGISFFTFQAISYLVDVFKKENKARKNILDLGLYIALFPQLIAGPIVRYNTIAGQLITRTVSLTTFEIGVTRFIYGLAKKLLIANPLGETADTIFLLPPDQIPALVAWTGILCFSLQIYFDFSGYSDMAIGLGRMFGFTFPENFNYPYSARSVRDFWKRWHISLTSWLRDYLYIPMGGSRCSSWRVMFNLLTVFVLCGLWHGASWNFLVWGLWHGLFLLLERFFLARPLTTLPRTVGHVYTLLVVLVGWVFFRLESIKDAGSFLLSMAADNGFSGSMYPVQLYITNESLIAGAIGIVVSVPLFRLVDKFFQRATWPACVIKTALLTLLLGLSVLKISSGTYNPFLYFRF